jgi:hypothetical protein
MNELAFTPESGLPMAFTKSGRGGGPAATFRALEQLKIKVEELKVVVIPHMHWDYEYFCDFIPDAQAIVEKREILAAIDPTPECRFGAPKEGTSKVLNRIQPNHLLIIDGDYEVWPGFLVIGTPGHTDGHCEVILQTTKGKASVGGENGTNPRSWHPHDPRGMMPGIDPAPYAFMQGSAISPQHCCGDPIEYQESVKKTRAILGEDGINCGSLSAHIRAIPFQWWEWPPEDYTKKLREMQAKDDYWEAGQGVFPDCYEFLKIREERLKKMGKLPES